MLGLEWGVMSVGLGPCSLVLLASAWGSSPPPLCVLLACAWASNPLQCCQLHVLCGVVHVL